MASALLPIAARAQQIDLSHGGQVQVTAAGGFNWDQKAQTVTAFDNAQAVRGNVTVTADRLIAYYRKKQTPPGAKPAAASGTPSPTPAAPGSATPASAPAPSPENPAPASPGDPDAPGGESGANEIYRLEAIGHVHIFTQTDQAFGDHAVYDIDKAVLVLTGHDLHLITPQDLLTARDSMEYYSQTRVSIGRGDATVTTNDGRRIRADVLVGYSAPPDPSKQPKPAPPAANAPAAANAPGQDPIASSGKLEKVNAFGNVVVRTRTETVTGDRGVYVPDTGISRIVGNVHITRGQNQLNGAAAVVNMRTGLATMTEDPGARVQGLIVPNEGDSNGGKSAAPAGTAKQK
ncbi:hypothetical protein NFI88_05515 [Acetobacteraceae bacterium KSS12]|uniref:Organic solvent tolerance-like N-terminal domain-containing protein n=2 Tax=Rhizosaccharibacter radicis TaxID=2782605 RepID=A0ABT1VVD7_9PROT|nr:hypothetical protein [Acetobacteraceae bacterium KSS12]